MLGQPVTLTLPKVVGCKLSGTINTLATSIDIVLGITKVFIFESVVFILLSEVRHEHLCTTVFINEIIIIIPVKFDFKIVMKCIKM